jgi:thioredoxin 1
VYLSFLYRLIRYFHAYDMGSSMKLFRLLFFCPVISLLPLSSSADSIPAPPADSSQMIAQKIIDSKVPVLLDFWAPWCGPCRILAPVIKAIEQKYKGKIKVMKVNTDVNRAIASYFGISAIPAVFLISDRTVVKALPGLQPSESYEAAIEELLASRAAKRDSLAAIEKRNAATAVETE